MRDLTILTSKITIPTLGHDMVLRPKLQKKLSSVLQTSLTVIVAGAGYGKTTALVQYLSSQSLPVSWYNPGVEDDQVFSFSAYLAGTLDGLLPGLKEWYVEKTAREEKFNWKIAFSILMAGVEFFGGADLQGILVIDDWQCVQGDMEICLFFDRFLACRPPGLRVIIMSREPTSLPEMERIRAKGAALVITADDLTFNLGDIEELFGKFKGLSLSKQQTQAIFACTEGWVIAIKLLANQWQERKNFAKVLCLETGDLDNLFEYLAQDVLGRQSPELQEFLLRTALVESFTVSYCKEVVAPDRASTLLNAVVRKGLFIYRIGQGVYRYHTLFRDFLCREAELRLPDLTALYAKVGCYYWEQENAERALRFLLLGEQWAAAGRILCEVARCWVGRGWDKLFHSYLEQLPRGYRRHPEFYLALGDAARFSCSYEQAIKWYEQAGQKFQDQQNPVGCSHSCRGIGETYLDIIQPAHAQDYLGRAYRALPAGQRDEKAALLGLMAENMVNHGASRRAERYHRIMVNLLPCAAEDKNNLYVRILLRTGRLLEAISILQQRHKQESAEYHVPRSFRESSLILSLCYTYIGQADLGVKLAQEGIKMAEKLRSPFVAAVGYARQSHALLLTYSQNREQCQLFYQQALELAQGIGVPRGFTEIYHGKSLMYALDGDWPAAKRIGLEGLRITETTQDEWFTAILHHTLGMGAALCCQYDEAKYYLTKGLQLFEKCRDVFGQTVCYWWLTFHAYHTKDHLAFTRVYDHLLDYCGRYGYQFLLERSSLLGDITGFSSQPFKAWRETLPPMEKSLSGDAESRALSIQTLGAFQVWRQGRKISGQEWRRSGAKQLLCLLLTARHALISKESLMLQLWPEADGEAAACNFKVVLHHLSNVLEPERQQRRPCRFIRREGAAYQLRLDTECKLDVDCFQALLAEGRSLLQQPQQAREVLLEAMSFYKGEYLAGENIDEYSLKERERLEIMAQQGAEMLTSLYIEAQSYNEAIHWAERILKVDNCWERAYQLLLTSYGKLGDAVMLTRTYKRCMSVLDEELGVKPSLLTRQIYEDYQAEG